MSLIAHNRGLGVAKAPDHDARRRKSLGQYFTGPRLARLLIAISEGSHFDSGIDPMSGSGDILAELKLKAPHAKLAGIEIDQNVYEVCSNRFSTVNGTPQLLHGDAFNWSTISQLSRSAFDLVATNPPYVRYQTLVGSSLGDNEPHSRSKIVRQGLLDICERLPHLTHQDREVFAALIKGYSGLSDLALPSWILCAMLTRVGGRLAMVVPHHWLSREYAYIIHYLLLKLFRILYVVEDTNRVWFEDAQVKTSLLIAERVTHNSDVVAACRGRSYLHVSLPASARTPTSEVGGLLPHAQHPEKEFAAELSRLNKNPEALAPEGWSISRRSLEYKLKDVIQRCGEQVWFMSCEGSLARSAVRAGESSFQPRVPQPLLDLLPAGASKTLTTIEALGISVGQGLRTGANEFFYCELLSENVDECLVAPGATLGLEPVLVPKGALRPVLRRQTELTSGSMVVPSELKGRVLVLDEFIHPEDLSRLKSTGGLFEDSHLIVMPPPLSDFVSTAAIKNVGSESEPKCIPEMSAVRTNRTTNDKRKTERYWYMLPKLVKRHLPDLLIPRINYLHPKAIMNSADRVVIDANFSTLWTNEGINLKSTALLAFLKSSWVVAAMELSATVFGGGALKLEAAHIRHLPVPPLSANDWARLSTLGEQLVSGMDVVGTLIKIDSLIACAVFGKQKVEPALAAIRQIKARSLDARKNK